MFENIKREEKTSCLNQLKSRVKPIYLYNKIQQESSIYCSNLINKQLGYDAIIETESDNHKIKNCVCSGRQNSEMFKRFSKNFTNNIREGVNQLMLFCGEGTKARIETSIGIQSNPGVFLIAALTYLDEKYKQFYQKCDIQVSFLEFRENCLFDLLDYTKKPLKKEERAYSTPISTFRHFMKLLKIALFNNKDRDFKTKQEDVFHSSFIMKIKVKLYNYDRKITHEQESILIDLQNNCKDSYMEKEKSGKTIMDYFFIEINNANPSNKELHYHLVQPNSLLNILKEFLVPKDKKYCSSIQKNLNEVQKKNLSWISGQIFVINTLASSKSDFQKNIKNIRNMEDLINTDWTARIQPKKIEEKLFKKSFIENSLYDLVQNIQQSVYPSIQQFSKIRDSYIKQIETCKENLKIIRILFKKYLKQKNHLSVLANQYVAYQVDLIGKCIKSQHFKDFYNSKSYLQLDREIQIKTESIKEQIEQNKTILEQILKKFHNTYKRQLLKFINVYKKQNTIVSEIKNTKFRKLGLNSSKQKQTNLILHGVFGYIFDYKSEVWKNFNEKGQRTLFEAIIFEQSIQKDDITLLSLLEKFIKNVCCISQTSVEYELQKNPFNQSHMTNTVFFGIRSKKNSFHWTGNQKKKNNKEKLPKITTCKMIVTGNLQLNELLIDPSKENSSHLI